MIQRLLIKIFKVFSFFYLFIVPIATRLILSVLLYLNGVKYRSIKSYGIPYVHVSMSGKCIIGRKLMMNNGVRYSDSGLNGKCKIDVRDKAILSIGDNVGMSDATIICHNQITIGNNVLLGVGTQVRDTDNHSLNPLYRANKKLDWENKLTNPIIIKDNVFIGANSIILKGVTIGANSIVGAGSIVTKNIPANEIWAGNPAKYIKKCQHQSL